MPNSLQVTTPTDLEIVMTRTFDAPRRLVWEAMVQPALIRQWLYSPEGWSMIVCEGQVEVGGAFHWAWNDPDGRLALTIRGVYREVLPPERIVHTEVMEMGTDGPLGELLATLVLSEEHQRTTLVMTLLFDSKQARDGALASGMERGVAAGYEALDRLLVELG